MTPSAFPNSLIISCHLDFVYLIYVHQIIGNKSIIYLLPDEVFTPTLFLNDGLTKPQIVFNKETASYSKV